MTGLSGIAGPVNPIQAQNSDRLKEAAQSLEGVFLEQLFRAMRETVHEEDGILGGTPENDTFSSMLDETIAQIASQKLHGGLGDALYRQLSQHIADVSGPGKE